MMYEYGVMWDTVPHRTGMTKEEAETWVRELYGDMPTPPRPRRFYVVRRPIGEWERYDGE